MAKKRHSGRPQPTNARVTPRSGSIDRGISGGLVASRGCGHPSVQAQMAELRRQGLSDWRCGFEVFHRDSPCDHRPDWAVAWPQDVGGQPHIIIGAFCEDHHELAVEHIAETAEVFDGASQSMGAPWSQLRSLLEMIHDPSGTGLCQAAAITFAAGRPVGP